MHPLLSAITHRGVVGEALKKDSYGDTKRELISKIDRHIRELQLVIDSGGIASSEKAIHFQALDVLYAAREAVESMSSILTG
jgi:hypothetical protein